MTLILSVTDTAPVTATIQVGTKFDVSVASESAPVGWVVTAAPANKTYKISL